MTINMTGSVALPLTFPSGHGTYECNKTLQSQFRNQLCGPNIPKLFPLSSTVSMNGECPVSDTLNSVDNLSTGEVGGPNEGKGNSTGPSLVEGLTFGECPGKGNPGASSTSSDVLARLTTRWDAFRRCRMTELGPGVSFFSPPGEIGLVGFEVSILDPRLSTAPRSTPSVSVVIAGIRRELSVLARRTGIAPAISLALTVKPAVSRSSGSNTSWTPVSSTTIWGAGPICSVRRNDVCRVIGSQLPISWPVPKATLRPSCTSFISGSTPPSSSYCREDSGESVLGFADESTRE